MACKPLRSALNGSAMSYAVKLYIYLGVWFVVATVLADQWLRHLSAPFAVTCGAVYAMMMIIVSTHWSLGQ